MSRNLSTVSLLFCALLFQGCSGKKEASKKTNADSGTTTNSEGVVAGGDPVSEKTDGDTPAEPVVDDGDICECAGTGRLADFDDDEDDGIAELADRAKRAVRRLALGGREAAVARRVVFGNLHSHSSYSDGVGTPEEAFIHARGAGELDFLALTEHNHSGAAGSDGIAIANDPPLYEGPGAESLVKVAGTVSADDEFIALYGQEVSSISKGNHVCVFDVPRVVDTTEVPNGDFDKLFEEWLPDNLDTTGQQALVQMNHPWNSNCPNAIEYGRDDFDSFTEWRSTVDAQTQLIEVVNGPSHSTGTGRKPGGSRSEWRRYLTLGFHLAPVANQDNHHRTWGTITDARTGVAVKSLTKENLIAALKARHAYASLDKNLSILARVNGKLYGSILDDRPDVGAKLAVEIGIEDGDEPTGTYWVEVFADKLEGAGDTQRAKLVATYGPLQATDDASEENLWELPDLEYDDWDYLYLRVQQGPEADPERQAWLAPVWFRAE